MAAGRELLRFPHPEPERPARLPVHPVFLPFAGCPQRCVYCDQKAQTGMAGQAHETIEETIARVRREVAVHQSPVELAFYGGTFTGLPPRHMRLLLELAQELRGAGKVARVRCSTRPDAIDSELLPRLAGMGLDLVELGVQTFHDPALALSRRGYDGGLARRACAQVLDCGLALGVQLLPGLPGHGPDDLARDVEIVAGIGPEFARLYPCLVPEGTALAELWRAGEYAPWPLPATVEALARALLTLWGAGVPVARLGLAEDQGLRILAGPRHPALGQMARARALLLHIRALLPSLSLSGGPPDTLTLPLKLRGEALGQGNELAGEYAALGLSVQFHLAWDCALSCGK